MKNIILIAPPSAGKGTISRVLSEKYHLPHISTGDLLRASVESDDEQGNYIKQQINLGKLVSDDIIFKLIEDRIIQEDCSNGYILDGFPRNIEQAKKYDELIKKLNINLGVPILLDISCEQAKKRVLGRVICSKCGAVYNIYSSETRPKNFGVCDKCGFDLIRRDDDTEEVFDKRYSIYLTETKPVVDYYRQKGKLFAVDASEPIDVVLNKIENILVDNIN